MKRKKADRAEKAPKPEPKQYGLGKFWKPREQRTAADPQEVEPPAKRKPGRPRLDGGQAADGAPCPVQPSMEGAIPVAAQPGSDPGAAHAGLDPGTAHAGPEDDADMTYALLSMVLAGTECWVLHSTYMAG